MNIKAIAERLNHKIENGKSFSVDQLLQIADLCREYRQANHESRSMSLDTGKQIPNVKDRIKYLDRMYSLQRKETIILSELAKFL